MALALTLVPAVGRAQQATETRLQGAIARYEAFDVEGARPIFLQIISPSYLEQVTPEQRARAYKYLGASYAVLAAPDTAITYFRAALDFDPFTDLDPSKFAASELDAFNRAKSEIFKVAMRFSTNGPAIVRPQAGLSLDSASYRFTFISTQRSNMRIVLQHIAPAVRPGQARADSAPEQVLYSGTNDGVRTVQWRGTLNDGTFAPPGTYSIIVSATPTLGGTSEVRDSRTFRLEHLYEPLEDTLPTLNPNNPEHLLPVAYTQFSIWQDLIKGGFVGGVAALALPAMVGSEINTLPHAIGSAGAVAIGAGVSFLYRRRNPQIRINVAENQRRQSVRTQFNQRVERSNRARIDATVMVLTPVLTAQ